MSEPSKLKGSIFITGKEIMLITGLTRSAAFAEHLAIRDALGRTTKRLTVKEYCNYWQLDYDEIVQTLNQLR